jgi:peptidoglycan hydrolase-like protein with peptidoglycan-binding domain
MADTNSQKVQLMLKALGYKVGVLDGVLGPMSTQAIKAFQSDYDINTSGKADQETVDTLYEAFIANSITVHGDVLQMMLHFAGHSPGSIDGVVGKNTQNAVYRFQQEQGLHGDGNWDDDTINLLKESLYA